MSETSASNGPNFRSPESLLPAIAQDYATGEVLMLAYMNQEAWQKTVTSGEVVYFSRSKNRLWKKGEQSGNVQKLREVFIDCDADTILLKVEQVGGAACHEGYTSCFFRKWVDGELKTVGKRIFDPDQVYGKS